MNYYRPRISRTEWDLIKEHRDNDNFDEIILCVSDLHIPYHHQDSISFLRAVKEHYNIEDKNPNHHIFCVGDEADFHGISMHDSEPSLDNQHFETIKARKVFQELESLFPKITLVHSNHGSMLYRLSLIHI